MQLRRGTKKYSLEELYNIASLYYLEKQTQDTIAKTVGKTRQEIAAMLREAEEKGLVTINLLAPESMRPSSSFLEDLYKKFPSLRSCWIVSDLPAGTNTSDIWQDNIPYEEIAGTMWNLISSHIRAPITLGIGHGRIVRDTLEKLSSWIAPGIHTEIVPMVGYEYAVGYTAESNTDYFSQLQFGNRKSGSTTVYPFPVPARLNPKQRQCMATVPMIKRTLDIYSQVNVVIAEIYLRDTLYTTYPDESSRSPLAAVGDLSGFLFGDQGKALDDQFQPYGIGVARLRELAASQDALVIGLSLAFRHGHNVAQATLAALQSGFVNALVIDVRIAKSLEELLNASIGIESHLGME